MKNIRLVNRKLGLKHLGEKIFGGKITNALNRMSRAGGGEQKNGEKRRFIQEWRKGRKEGEG